MKKTLFHTLSLILQSNLFSACLQMYTMCFSLYRSYKHIFRSHLNGAVVVCSSLNRFGDLNLLRARYIYLATPNGYTFIKSAIHCIHSCVLHRHIRTQCGGPSNGIFLPTHRPFFFRLIFGTFFSGWDQGLMQDIDRCSTINVVVVVTIFDLFRPKTAWNSTN